MQTLSINYYYKNCSLQIRSSFTAMTSKLKSIQGITLNIANKVYLKTGPYELNPELEEDAVKVFDASFEKLNFNDGPASADAINKWVIYISYIKRFIPM